MMHFAAAGTVPVLTQPLILRKQKSPEDATMSMNIALLLSGDDSGEDKISMRYRRHWSELGCTQQMVRGINAECRD